MGANDRVRVGLIGCGGISVADTRAFCAHPEVEIPVLCDVDDPQIAATLERFQKENWPKSETLSTESARAFCAHPEVEIPVLCDVDDAQIAATLERFQKENWPKPETVKDFRRILERKDIDACLRSEEHTSEL